jgi:hypothetical protein
MREDMLRPMCEASLVKRVFVSWSVNGRISSNGKNEVLFGIIVDLFIIPSGMDVQF